MSFFGILKAKFNGFFFLIEYVARANQDRERFRPSLGVSSRTPRMDHFHLSHRKIFREVANFPRIRKMPPDREGLQRINRRNRRILSEFIGRPIRRFPPVLTVFFSLISLGTEQNLTFYYEEAQTAQDQQQVRNVIQFAEETITAIHFNDTKLFSPFLPKKMNHRGNTESKTKKINDLNIK